MKKYNVESRKDVNDCWDNYVGDYVEAETPEEALDFAKDRLFEDVQRLNDFDFEELETAKKEIEEYQYRVVECETREEYIF